MTAKSKIKWSPVLENSSSTDAVLSFAAGESLRESLAMVWDPQVKKIFSELKKLPVELARERARSWGRRQGYAVERVRARRSRSISTVRRKTSEFYEEVDLVGSSLHKVVKDYEKLVGESVKRCPAEHDALWETLEELKDVIAHTNHISNRIMHRGGPNG